MGVCRLGLLHLLGYSQNSHEPTGTAPSVSSSVPVIAHPDDSHWRRPGIIAFSPQNSEIVSLFTSSLCFLWLYYLQQMLPSNLSINFSVCFSPARSLINKIRFGLVVKLQHQQCRIGRDVDTVFRTKKCITIKKNAVRSMHENESTNQNQDSH